ncbi:MAG: hypothetical protein IJM25_11890 [Eubacterium sp.]|nr:hypothetical protein [Eubacterium sp.]
MQSHTEYYDTFVGFFRNAFEEVFGEEISEIEVKKEYEKSGYFRIVYRYIPENYTLKVDCHRKLYDIFITDDEGAMTNLYRVTKFDNDLTQEKIREAVRKVKDIVESEDMVLYIYRDNKVYRKTKDGVVRRVKK